MPDGGNNATFVVRLVNQVMGPARQIQSAMGGVEKAFKSTQKAMAAPASRTGALSQWEKMVGGAKRGQAADFAKSQRSAQIKSDNIQSRLNQFHADHGIASSIGRGGSAAALGATVAVTAAALAAAAAVGYIGVKFAQASVEASMFGQRSRLAIGLLTGNAAGAGAEFDSVRHEAQSLGLDIEGTQQSFQKLLAAQFSIGKSKELIRMGADMQAIGASTDQVSRSILAISQIKNTGYLQGDELNQLREAGVSTELIYKSLGKSLHKTTAEIVQMQSKRQLKSEPVIEAILDAVRTKTGSKNAGDAGKVFADTTLTGMLGKAKGGISNFFIDIGDLILPGLTKIAGLIQGTIEKLTSDPNILGLGYFLLDQFDTFVSWVQVNWPMIETVITTAIYAVGEGLEFLASLFDSSTVAGAAFQALMMLLAVAFGVLMLAGAAMMAPIYAVIAGIGWLINELVAFGTWFDTIRGLGPTGETVGVAANDNAIQGVTAAGGVQALSGMGATLAGAPPVGAPVHIAAMNIHTAQSDDPQKQATMIGEAVHTEMAKVMRQAAG